MIGGAISDCAKHQRERHQTWQQHDRRPSCAERNPAAVLHREKRNPTGIVIAICHPGTSIALPLRALPPRGGFVQGYTPILWCCGSVVAPCGKPLISAVGIPRRILSGRYHRGPCRRPTLTPGSGRMLVRALPTRTKTHGATLRDRRAPVATHARSPAPGRGSGRPRQASCSASQRSASSAAMHPIPAEVIACRYVWSVRSPAAKTPSTEVWVLPGSTFT